MPSYRHRYKELQPFQHKRSSNRKHNVYTPIFAPSNQVWLRRLSVLSSFFLPIFLFIYNMINNLKSVTLFQKFFPKTFSLFFVCPPDDMPQDAAATRRPFFQTLRAYNIGGTIRPFSRSHLICQIILKV